MLKVYFEAFIKFFKGASHFAQKRYEIVIEHGFVQFSLKMRVKLKGYRNILMRINLWLAVLEI